MKTLEQIQTKFNFLVGEKDKMLKAISEVDQELLRLQGEARLLSEIEKESKPEESKEAEKVEEAIAEEIKAE